MHRLAILQLFFLEMVPCFIVVATLRTVMILVECSRSVDTIIEGTDHEGLSVHALHTTSAVPILSGTVSVVRIVGVGGNVLRRSLQEFVVAIQNLVRDFVLADEVFSHRISLTEMNLEERGEVRRK